MKNSTNILLIAILVLVVINLTLTATLIIKQPFWVTVDRHNDDEISVTASKEWGDRVVDLYNSQNDEALYALFDESAKVKISHQQLKTQLGNLYELFGKIERSVLQSTSKLGEKMGESYFKLIFNVRVNEAAHKDVTLTLSVIVSDDNIRLYGLRLNASQKL